MESYTRKYRAIEGSQTALMWPLLATRFWEANVTAGYEVISGQQTAYIIDPEMPTAYKGISVPVCDLILLVETLTTANAWAKLFPNAVVATDNANCATIPPNQTGMISTTVSTALIGGVKVGQGLYYDSSRGITTTRELFESHTHTGTTSSQMCTATTPVKETPSIKTAKLEDLIIDEYDIELLCAEKQKTFKVCIPSDSPLHSLPYPYHIVPKWLEGKLLKFGEDETFIYYREYDGEACLVLTSPISVDICENGECKSVCLQGLTIPIRYLV